MAGLMDLFGGGADIYGDLITPEQRQALANQQMLNIGLAILMGSTGQAGGPMPTLGQAVGGGFMAGQKGYQQGIENLLNAQVLRQKVLDNKLKTDMLQRRMQIVGGNFGQPTAPASDLPPSTVGVGDPLAASGAPSLTGAGDGFSVPGAGEVPQLGGAIAGTVPATGGTPRPNTTYTVLMGKAKEFESKAQRLEQIGDFETANTYYQRANNYYTQANQYQPEFGQPVAVGGKMVRYDKRGGSQVVGEVTPEITQVNAGGSILLYDKNNPQAGPLVTVPVTATPNELSQAQDRAERLAFDKRVHSDNQAKGTVLQTSDGIYRVPNDPNAPATQVMGTGGKPLQPKLQTPPQYAVEGVAQNNVVLQNIDDAMTMLKTTSGGNATGLKANLPQALLNRMDPEGVDTRAAIANVGSLQIKNRSGATVTIQEEPRLIPFIPLPTDNKATVEKKLKRLRQEIQSMNDYYRGTFSPERGFQGLPDYQYKPATNTGELRSLLGN